MGRSNNKFQNKKKSLSPDEQTFVKEDPKQAWKPSGPKRVNTYTRSGNRRGKGKGDTQRGSGDTQPHYAGSNDVRWYARTDELLSNVGRLSFNYPSGTDIPYLLGKEGGFANLDVGSGVWINPGVMSIGLVPTYGINKDNSSPLNVAAKQGYNRIRMENSGAKNYDHTDLIKYYIGVDSLYMFYAWMVRSYGLLNNYTFHNKYMPRALVFATGMDYDDLVMNSPNFMNYINNYAKRLTAYLAPRDMPIFERHFTMITGIYKDTESPRSQFYLYTPAILYRYKVSAQPGEELFDEIYLYNNAGTESNCKGLTFAQIAEIGDSLLNAMDDQDMYTMAGDILKAYGESGVWTQGVIGPDYTTNPVFDFTWLTQVQNMRAVPSNVIAGKVTDGVMDPYTISNAGWEHRYSMKEVIPSSTASPFITTTLKWTGSGGPCLAHKALLCSPYNEPSPGDVMESTRLTIAGTSKFEGGYWINEVTDCGSEVVVNVHVINFLGVGTTNVLARRPIVTHYYSADGESNNFLTTYQNFVELDNFAMHPIVYVITHAATVASVSDCTVRAPFVDLDNYTLVGTSELHNLHYEAILSLLFSGNVGGGRMI